MYAIVAFRNRGSRCGPPNDSPTREQFCSDEPAARFYSEGMDRDLRNSLEAIANLVYLIRHSLHDPAAAIAYVDFTEERLRAVTVHFGLCPCASIAQRAVTTPSGAGEDHRWLQSSSGWETLSDSLGPRHP
jgi:hypothetical protein